MIFTHVLKYEGDNKTVVWKHPTEDFNTGSTLIVRESQEAIFISNGQILDIFGAGRHILETENLPLIRTVMKLATGGRQAFKAELYFINMVEQMAIKWGTDSKMSYIDPVYEFPLELGACGEMSLSVNNSAKLLIKLVGTEKSLSQEQLICYLRAFVLTRTKSSMVDEILRRKINVFEIDRNMTILSETIQAQLIEEFIEYGITLNSFRITTILKPDEDRNYIKFKELFYRQRNDVMEAQLKQKTALIDEETKAKATVMEAEAMARKRQVEGYTYQQEKGYEVARDVAQNEAVGQFENVGLGLGMITGVGGTIGKSVGEITEKTFQGFSVGNTISDATEKQYCKNCGRILSAGALFCEKCGTKVQTNNTCSVCGYILDKEANFCSHCGTKRGN